MTSSEQVDRTYTTSKSFENFASSLGPSLYPAILDFPPAIVVTPVTKMFQTFKNTILLSLIIFFNHKQPPISFSLSAYISITYKENLLYTWISNLSDSEIQRISDINVPFVIHGYTSRMIKTSLAWFSICMSRHSLKRSSHQPSPAVCPQAHRL